MISRFRSVYLIAILFVASGQLSCGQDAGAAEAAFGRAIKFQVEKPIRFPDFTIEYIGERRQSSQVYPRGFLYYDFKLRSSKSEKAVSWTSGTGLIDATDFEIDGTSYQLEMRRSEKLGKLADDEFVLWKMAGSRREQ